MDIPFLVLGIGLALMFGLIIVFAALARFRRVYHFSVRSHEVALEIGSGGVFLYVDGNLEEQSSGKNMRFVTLHAMIDGEEFKVHISARGLRPDVEAVYAGNEVPCLRVTK